MNVVYLILSVIDVKKREFPAVVIWAVVALSVAYALFIRKCDIWEFMMIAGFMAVEMIVFKVLGGRIGMADILISVSMTLVMGLINGLVAIWVACVMCGVIGVVIMLAKRRKKLELPMVPFLTLAKIIVEVI